jgi:uncharacterized OB-fold protein
MPPAPFCWNCRAQDVEWVTLTGMASVYTFTVARQPLIPQLRDVVPYIVAVVELDDAPGVRLIANLVDIDVDRVEIGMPVEVVWDQVDGETAIPRFAPVRDGQKS